MGGALPAPTDWRDRAAVLTEATQALLTAAVSAAMDADKGGQSIATSASQFDSIAAALEEDLLAFAIRNSSSTAASHGPTRSCAAHLKQLFAVRREIMEPPTKRVRR